MLFQQKMQMKLIEALKLWRPMGFQALKIRSDNPIRLFCQNTAVNSPSVTKTSIRINGVHYNTDEWSNVTERMLSHIGRNLHMQTYHPLNLIKQRIVRYMYSKFCNKRGNPLFSVYDNFSPVVSTEQNFDQLLIPTDHPSRKKTDTYYVNSNWVLRSQTSAHQLQLIRSGLDNFVVIGDVYRKDSIDSQHYPVFHQVEGVRLCEESKLFYDTKEHAGLKIFEKGLRTPEKQEVHTLEAVKLMEHELKTCLVELSRHLFGEDLEYQWVESYFPFTHPSFELEVNLGGEWTEMLGCGIMEDKLLKSAGANEKIGWAFGLGLERFAMKVYGIPDIRLFWSTDSGFLNQFEVDNPYAKIKYKAISRFPQCVNDISFWLRDDSFASNDFYELVRRVAGDIVEQVSLVDEYRNPKNGKCSHCYRIVYRHMEKTLLQEEVNQVHKQIENAASKEFGVTVR